MDKFLSHQVFVKTSKQKNNDIKKIIDINNLFLYKFTF